MIILYVTGVLEVVGDARRLPGGVKGKERKSRKVSVNQIFVKCFSSRSSWILHIAYFYGKYS